MDIKTCYCPECGEEIELVYNSLVIENFYECPFCEHIFSEEEREKILYEN